MPAPVSSECDVSEGKVSEANPEANHQCEGGGSTAGVESWQGSHASTAPPALAVDYQVVGGVWLGASSLTSSDKQSGLIRSYQV